MYQYSAYGFSIHSEIPLPELAAPVGSNAADVHITLGGVPDRLDNVLAERVSWTARPGEWLQEVRGVARYYVKDGCEVRIEPHGSEDDIRAFLFALTLVALLHQRELLTLHASSVFMQSGAIAIAGHSTAGKSTTLAELIHRGYPMITDDKTALYEENGKLIAPPGYPTVRLWEHALERLGVDPSGLPRVRDGLGKYLFRTPLLHTDPAPLRALFMLKSDTGSEVVVERLDNVAAFECILNETFCNGMVRGFGIEGIQFRLATQLASLVPVYQLTRPRHTDTVAEVVDSIVRTVQREQEA